MGQQSLLRKPPSPGPLQSPEGDPTWLDQLAHKLGVFGGLSEQRPRDVGDAVAAASGAMVPMLPMSKLLKLLQMGRIASEVDEVPRAINMGDQLLRNHSLETELSPMLKNEFNPKLRKSANDFEGLPIEEVKKGEKLTSQKRKPSEPRPTKQELVGEDPLDFELDLSDASPAEMDFINGVTPLKGQVQKNVQRPTARKELADKIRARRRDQRGG